MPTIYPARKKNVPFGQWKPHFQDQILSSDTTAQGLVHLYSMHEGGGTSITDHFGRLNGTLSAATWQTAKFGRGIQFANTGHISLSPIVIPTTGTFLVWYRPESAFTNYHPIFRSYITGSANFDFYAFTDGNTYAGWQQIGNDDRIATTTSGYMTVGVWHQLALTWINGGATTLYRNGISIASTATLNATWDTSTATNTYIGKDANTGGAAISDHAGSYDHVVIWNRALPVTELQKLYVEPFAFLQPIAPKVHYFLEVPITHEGDSSLTGTATLSASSAVTKSASSSLTGAATLSASSSVTKSASSSLTGIATLTADGLVTRNAESSLTGTATLSASSSVTKSASSSLTGTATLSASSSVTKSASSSLTGTATLSADGSVVYNASSSLTGTATLSASSAVTKSASSSLTGTATLSASGLVARNASSSLTGTATLSAGGSVVYNASSSLTGTATLSASSAVTKSASVSLTGTATLSADGLVARNTSSSLTGTATLSASSAVTKSASSSLTGTATLSAGGSVVYNASSSLTGTATLSASGITLTLAEASLIATSTLSADGVRLLSANASLLSTSAIDATGSFICIGEAILTGVASLSAVAKIIKSYTIEKILSWNYEGCILRTFRVEGKCEKSSVYCSLGCEKDDQLQSFVVNVVACTVEEVCAKLKASNFVRKINKISVFNKPYFTSNSNIDESLDDHCLIDVTPDLAGQDCQECCDFLVDEDLVVISQVTTEILDETFNFNHVSEGEISISGSFDVLSSHYDHAMSGVIEIIDGIEYEFNIFDHAMDGSIDVTGGFDVDLVYLYETSGSISLEGSCEQDVFDFTMSGEIVLEGEFDITSNNYYHAGNGEIVLGGEFVYSSTDLGTIDFVSKVVTEIENEAAVFSADEATEILPVFQTVNFGSCCSTPIPVALEINHNINRMLSLSRFLLRNKITIPDSIPFQYRPRFRDWHVNLHYEGQSAERSGTEKWDIMFQMLCLDDLVKSWQFMMLIKKTNSQDFIVRTLNTFSVDDFCPDTRRFDGFGFAFNIKDRSSIPDGLKRGIFYDESDMFRSSPYFTKKPNLIFRIEAAGSNNAITEGYLLELQRKASASIGV